MSFLHTPPNPPTIEPPKGLREHSMEVFLHYFQAMDAASSEHSHILKSVEAGLYAASMKYMNGNQSRAARFLGVSRGTLRTKLKEYFNSTNVGFN